MERKPFDPKTMPPYPPNVDRLPASERSRALRRARNSVRNGRMQDHKPLLEQNAIGHAVRAGYVYSAMADIARFMDAPDYERALNRIWEDAVYRKMYITGSIGTAQYHDEGFGDPYLLPNRTYCESCAGIAHVLWQHRMAMLKGDAKYADVMELALYNGAISGISVAGDSFFYQNPLLSKGGRRSSGRSVGARGQGLATSAATGASHRDPRSGAAVRRSNTRRRTLVGDRRDPARR